MTQIDNTHLKLVYKKAFLEHAEKNKFDISPTITLYDRHTGRKFAETYSFALKANTPPPAIKDVLVGKTTTADASGNRNYVLCFKIPEMDTKFATGDLVHNDGLVLHIAGGASLDQALSISGSAFAKPSHTDFLVAADVEKLKPTNDDLPSGNWALFYKTDVAIQDGVAPKNYTLWLTDESGLSSKKCEASTAANRPDKLSVALTTGALENSGDSVDVENVESSAYLITMKPSKGDAAITITSPTAGTTVHCTITVNGNAQTASGASPLAVTLPLVDGAATTYKVEIYASGAGFANTATRTFYYKTAHKYELKYQSGPDITNANGLTKTHISGTSTTLKDAEATGYSLDKWTFDQAGSNAVTAKTITGNYVPEKVNGAKPDSITLYAKWTPNTNTAYKVEHWQENVLDSNYTKYETQDLTGTSDANASVTPKIYTGFGTGTYTAATIKPDGSTLIRVEYKRNVVTVKFDPNGAGAMAGFEPTIKNAAGTAVTTLVTHTSIKYGSTLNPDPQRTGYTFAGWKDSVGTVHTSVTTAPAANTTYTAQWTAKTNTAYKVEHWQEKLGVSGTPTWSTDYEIVLADTENLAGTTDAAITSNKTYEGFELAGTDGDITIKPNGTAVLKRYYKRSASIRLEFTANGGTIYNSAVFESQKFGSTVTPLPTASQSGWDFDGWKSNSSAPDIAAGVTQITVPAVNTTYTAKWKRLKVEVNATHLFCSWNCSGLNATDYVNAWGYFVVSNATETEIGNWGSNSPDRSIWYANSSTRKQVRHLTRRNSDNKTTLTGYSGTVYVSSSQSLHTYFSFHFDPSGNGSDQYPATHNHNERSYSVLSSQVSQSIETHHLVTPGTDEYGVSYTYTVSWDTK